MESSFLYGLLAIIGAYIMFRFVFSWKMQQRAGNTVDKEVNDVLNKEEYKVKGRFE